MIIATIILSLSILILVHELGHFSAAKIFGVKVEEFGLGFPPRIFSKKIGDTIYSVNLLPFGGFVKIYKEHGEFSEVLKNREKDRTEDRKELDKKKGLVDLAIWKRVIIMASGVFMNVALAFVVLSVIFTVGASRYIMINEVLDKSPASMAGLIEGDLILGASKDIEGEEVKLKEPVTGESFISFVGERPEVPVNLIIQRGEEEKKIIVFSRADPPPGEGHLGIFLSDIGFEKMPFFTSIIQGAKTTFFSLGIVSIGFFNFFTELFLNPEIVETIAGPVGIFSLAARAGQLGFVYLFQLMAFISLNLAVLNLIPFPALDGGRILFLIFEKIKGKPISLKTQGIVNAFGFFLLILLMIVVTIKDIKGLF